ncbi:hypothetical protein PC116_g26859 [Phytophthora cactorum]|nr:hypothetical protein PC114_g25121 [Phytophthora cactorum]KAG2966282.1 hypothetical protein PC119_g24753 [Phytophthora cactorum]KAG4224694.1 hypothetical protein PC116_g26859 [Phytophthora cactorum]
MTTLQNKANYAQSSGGEPMSCDKVEFSLGEGRAWRKMYKQEQEAGRQTTPEAQ